MFSARYRQIGVRMESFQKSAQSVSCALADSYSMIVDACDGSVVAGQALFF